MPFMVIYRTGDGATGYEHSDAIDEAALFVERLRNTDGADDIRIFRMEEINFAFRPYYKVELGMPQRRQTDVARSETTSTPPTTGGEPRHRTEGPATDSALQQDPAPASAPRPPALTPPTAGADDDMDVDTNGARRGLFGR